MGAVLLDPKRPFGTISGDTLGRMYEQDHQYFNADGSAWVEPAVVAPAEPASAAPEDAPAPKPAAKKGRA